jgi:DNA-binding transcriptional MerR regulator
MSSALTIGDFARATHLNVKTLRHYHHVGLLEPADVDAGTGYRRYSTDQIPIAQVIRRFRDLDMPLAEIRAVLEAPDLATRNERIAAHLRRLEESLARTGTAVSSLRELLDAPPAAEIEQSRVPATHAAAITDVLDARDIGPWFAGALGELRATLEAQRLVAAGPPGGLYATGLFTDDLGEATLFLPSERDVRPTGRVREIVVPAAELATTTHAGSHDDVDRAYGALATYVAEHAIGIGGPIRETYLVGRLDTADPSLWRTRIGWPIFRTGAP